MERQTSGSSTPASIDPGDADDGDLIALMARGDRRAFAQLYERHVAALYAYAARLLQSREEVEESVQETFVAAWEKLPDIPLVGSSTLPWLLVTCRYKSFNRGRSSDRRQRHERPLVDEWTKSTAPSTTDQVEATELMSLLASAVEKLSEIDRLVYELCILDGFTYDEAARALGATTGVVRNRLSRLRLRLRNELKVLRGTR